LTGKYKIQVSSNTFSRKMGNISVLYLTSAMWRRDIKLMYA
jgi:hypothetical protein